MKVLLLIKRKYEIDYYCELHFHKFYHFIYLLSGRGKMTIGEQDFDVKKDTLYLTHKNVLHWYKPEDRNGLQTLEVKFSESDSGLCKEIDQLPSEVVDTNLYIKGILDDAVAEGIERGKHYKEMINMKVSEMLFYLFRNYGKTCIDYPVKQRNVIDKVVNKNLHEAIIYMEKNFSSPLDLDTLAGISCYNTSYFCKIFRSKMGTPPIHYLINLRIEKAKELLRESDMTVSEVAYAAGFDSIHYFSRCFSKWEKCSPNAYRERFCNNIFLTLDHRGYYLGGIVPN